MDFRFVVCSEGEKWFPWNYGRKSPRGRVGMETAEAQPGLRIINAVSPSGRILGSCSLRVGYRHSDYLMADEEFQYGTLGATSPAYFWPDDDSPWIMTLKSFWVRPEVRREGVARAFADYARNIGLPAYLAFANKEVKEWFDRDFRPGRKRSKLQRLISNATKPAANRDLPAGLPDFTVHFQAEASALLLWRSYTYEYGEIVELSHALFSPTRMDEWAADSGEAYEAGFSDSAFAADRSFGYQLHPIAHEWGPGEGPFDLIDEDGDFDAAEESYDKQSRYSAGIIDGWITDPAAVLSYATVRHFLRTLEWHQFTELQEAVGELFIRDLEELPRGLRRFHAMVSPLNEPSSDETFQ